MYLMIRIYFFPDQTHAPVTMMDTIMQDYFKCTFTVFLHVTHVLPEVLHRTDDMEPVSCHVKVQ